jgi:hypothetical protein
VIGATRLVVLGLQSEWRHFSASLIMSGLFSFRQWQCCSHTSAGAIADDLQAAAQRPPALLHSTQTNPNPCPGFVKTGELLGRDAFAAISDGQNGILIIGA